MSLYNDFRPASLDEIFGNEATVKSLSKFITMSPDKRPHTYMFTGPSGCGKTTLARILANEYGCSNMDLIELNAANTRGIEAMREVVDQSHLAPMDGKARVVILDESHQLTTPAQQALLKVLEDTPRYAYYIFCTTDPQRIIPTIRNRCTTFQVNTLSPQEIGDLVDGILKVLETTISDNIWEKLIATTDGSPRKALVLLEQLISLDNEEEQEKIIYRSQTETETIELCRALLRGCDWNTVIEIYKGINDKEPEKIRRAILGYMKSVALNSNTDTAMKSVGIIAVFENSTFDSGEAGLIRMLYQVSGVPF
jgi:DNA polymerase III gamma/tau subunit